MRVRIFWFIAVAVGSLLMAGPVGAQAPDTGMAAMMAQWAKYATPGPHHQEMAKMVGKWTATVKTWMAPGTPPMESQGMGEFTMVLGGRYLIQDFKSQMMGQPFEGMGISAYDNFRGRYVDVWVDNMSTGMMISYGTADSTGKVFTYKGKMDDVMSGKKDVPIRTVMRIIDNDTQMMEMYGPDQTGKEYKTMEMVYKRQK